MAFDPNMTSAEGDLHVYYKPSRTPAMRHIIWAAGAVEDLNQHAGVVKSAAEEVQKGCLMVDWQCPCPRCVMLRWSGDDSVWTAECQDHVGHRWWWQSFVV